MLLWNAYRRNPFFLGLHETINRYTKSVLRKQHAFEQFFLLNTLRLVVWCDDSNGSLPLSRSEHLYNSVQKLHAYLLTDPISQILSFGYI